MWSFGLRANPSVWRDALVPPHNEYDCFRFRREARSLRGQVFFWGSTVPPRPYLLPLDGRAATGKWVEFAPLRYVRLPFREIAASRVALLAMTRRYGGTLD